MEQQLRIAAYAVIMRDNNILMVHTRSGSKDIINFPGGRVEPGEDFIEAIKRECREELGMNVVVDKFLYSSKSLHTHEDFPTTSMHHFYFLATTDGVVCAPAELQAEWFPLAHPPIDRMLPIDQEFTATIAQNGTSTKAFFVMALMPVMGMLIAMTPFVAWGLIEYKVALLYFGMMLTEFFCAPSIKKWLAKKKLPAILYVVVFVAVVTLVSYLIT